MSASPLHEARIELAAIRDNAAVLAERAGSIPLLADVSGDGYGHGALESALAALRGGAVWLGVSNLDEAAELRLAGIHAPIFAAIAGDAARARELDVAFEPSVELVRAKEELYGLTVDPELRPAMRVSALVVAAKTVEPGDGVSYGYTYRAEVRTTLALVGLGYADGLDRAASNRGTVLLNGRPRLIAGRVAMNVHVLELGVDVAAIGDEAVLFGDPAVGEPSAIDWAAHLDKTPAEVTSVLGQKLPKRSE